MDGETTGGRSTSLSKQEYAEEGWTALVPCNVTPDLHPQYSAVQYSTVQYSAVQYSTVQCSAVQCSTVQYSVVQCMFLS